MTDLQSIATLQRVEHELVHPATGASLGVWFVLAGPEHPARKRARFDASRKIRERILADEVGLDQAGADDEIETDVLVASTLGWHGPEGGPVLWGGQPLPWSAVAARQLYNDPERHWLREQVKQALERRALFIGGSPAA